MTRSPIPTAAIALVLGGVGLAACAPPVEVDAGAEACKAAAARSMSVTADQATAVRGATDMSGLSTYTVVAGGTGFRCTVAEDGGVVGLTQG